MDQKEIEEALRKAQPAWVSGNTLGSPVPVLQVMAEQNTTPFSVQDSESTADIPTIAFDDVNDAPPPPARGSLQPWSIFNLTGVSPNYTARVWPGTVNGILPGNIMQTFSVSGSGVNVLKAVVSTNGQSIQSVDIQVGQAQPQVATLFSLPTTVEIAFGVIADLKIYRTIGSGNITLTPELAFVKDKDSAPSISQLVYENWYIWRIQS
jgi:hypothetical protein